MSLSFATNSTSTDSAESRHPNAAVIETIRAHHGELAQQLHERTWAVRSAAELGDWTAARDALHDWYRDELMPHIVAEENALYGPAEQLDAARLLVCGMLAEHRMLVSLIADLALAADPFETALTAASAQVLFAVHLSKENELLLPALDAAGLDLAAMLDGLHELLGAAGQSSGHGCGCGCSDEHSTVHVEAADDALDVRTLPHGQRHGIIFARLEALGLGASLVILNDHDPKPLRYQIEALWPDRFVWTYQESGPETWRVKITSAR